MTKGSRKHIAHLDLDCFYVSVERIKNPSLIGKPVIVGGSPSGRGVVASASYEARGFGVRSAMPTARALRLCPHLIVVPGRYDEYEQYSEKLYRRMLELAPIVERASIDEMYLDFSGCERIYGYDLSGFMKTLQRLIGDEFRLPCTIALASNKTVAKIATGSVKPAGVIFVPHGNEKEFLAPLPVEVIPGVGEITSETLNREGLRTIADLQKTSVKRLKGLLGAHGMYIHTVAEGLGSASVSFEHTRKSMSREETFGRDIANAGELEDILFMLVEDVCSSLRPHGWKARTVGLKLRYRDFSTLIRHRTIEPTSYDPDVFHTVKELFRETYDRSTPVRLLGVSLSHFVDATEEEPSLFPAPAKRGRLTGAVDAIRKKYGTDIIHIGKA